MEQKYMTAKELIGKNTLKGIWVGEDGDGVVFAPIAETAVNMAHMEMRDKAIAAFKNWRNQYHIGDVVALEDFVKELDNV